MLAETKAADCAVEADEVVPLIAAIDDDGWRVDDVDESNVSVSSTPYTAGLAV